MAPSDALLHSFPEERIHLLILNFLFCFEIGKFQKILEILRCTAFRWPEYSNPFESAQFASGIKQVFLILDAVDRTVNVGDPPRQNSPKLLDFSRASSLRQRVGLFQWTKADLPSKLSKHTTEPRWTIVWPLRCRMGQPFGQFNGTLKNLKLADF